MRSDTGWIAFVMQENEGGRECKKGLARRREGGEGLNEGAGAGAGLVAGLERARKGGGLRGVAWLA